jgi:hypothetical protein
VLLHMHSSLDEHLYEINYIYACHYLQNIITVSKFKLPDLEKFNTK